MKTEKVNELEVVETNFEVINLDSLQEMNGSGCFFWYKRPSNSNYCSNYCNNTCGTPTTGGGGGTNTRRY